ncbi:chemotaxis protein CheD [Methanoculleus sp. FWC-SCC1]|uniref:Probable chemoreceptor glutamine deamidase CheD n=1 Tax=Methanoculleus frigidifontis TaxID=2584085 RepID=A0ABT8M629_9EURY|nr:chemotaxis protein CheD [Methanoculleus sp. FWC-SCC1]MDN7023392.1 chemotaxis protein CheD [Methanoculleus sp. FWC-SCC1]
MDRRFSVEGNAVIIGIGDYRVGSFPMATVGLGSCVALILYDARRSIGGLAHVMLPASRGETDRPGKFADTALAVVLREMEDLGCVKTSIVAKLVGGASMFEYSAANLNIGERNVEEIRALLQSRRIRIEAEETGGKVGRSVMYRPGDGGRITVKRADGRCVDL